MSIRGIIMEQENFSPVLGDVTMMYINDKIPPVPRHIVCAACVINLTDGEEHVIAGVRHWDGIMHGQYDVLVKAGVADEIKHRKQGFLDQYGQYVDRRTAMVICKTNDQKIDMERNSHETDLFSEGLY